MAYREDIPYNIVSEKNDSDNRKDYWEIGKGLQAVDGLPTSKYLDQVMADTLGGKYNTEAAQRKISEYYDGIDPNSQDFATKEGDEVTARIAVVLETYLFTFSPVMLKKIHKELFEGISASDEYQAGKFRKVNITKEEPILNGESVRYADYRLIQDQLDYDFEKEANSEYTIPFGREDIKMLANFISGIWETHAFREGNTRTIAVFLVLYIRSMGVPTNNDYFKKYSDFFRDALVRYSYSNIAKGIKPDYSYLEMFLENMLMDSGHDLELQELGCPELFKD